MFLNFECTLYYYKFEALHNTFVPFPKVDLSFPKELKVERENGYLSALKGARRASNFLLSRLKWLNWPLVRQISFCPSYFIRSLYLIN